jgi:hypothetical protein
MPKMRKGRMPAARKPPGGKTARGVKFAGKGGRKKTARKVGASKGAAKKMPFGATKAPGARKSQPAQKKAMGATKPRKSRKKK